ncbi:SAM-dependent methyltransferase [Rhodopirellula halodulae]|uniref:SAM-dependent methyltransferase n=1 Tax=Rhodopirellula halodulae TaxID=2894198 RepID=UPI001E3D49E0|nr:SAM-dependent methyltransferase [Rhodopirellula sp. JC737]MCC9656887.1 SAM-dependent methyltransferase [Rhodopirellula sp. JC737]
MMCCAHGAEGLVKEQIAREGWRLAFSRPGFVTAKHDQPRQSPTGVFIRTTAKSLGSAKGDHSSQLIEKLKAAIANETVAFDQLHVWPRDRTAIGKFDFEPGIDEVSAAVADEIFQGLNDLHVATGGTPILKCTEPNQIAESGERVLDVVLVDPSQWFFGMHEATTLPTRWPGGVQPVQPAYEPISRAYFKAAESIAWSGFDMRPGDLAVEVGSAPGGACGRLLEMGMDVIGVDPAEMDPRINNHPRFIHYPARAGDLPRRVFRGAKWLLVDSTVKPDATLSTVRNMIDSRETDFRGLLITMKLGQYDNAENLNRWCDFIRSWGVKRLEVRQLARNRCEVCAAVTV